MRLLINDGFLATKLSLSREKAIRQRLSFLAIYFPGTWVWAKPVCIMLS